MKKFTVLSIMTILCIMLVAAGCGSEPSADEVADKVVQKLELETNSAYEGACQDNLRTIDGSIMTYSAATGGSYPTSISQLVPMYLRAVPTCPVDDRAYTLKGTTPPRAVCPNGHTY